MEEEEFQPFLDSIARKSWARILKIVGDAIGGEERTQEDKTEKISDQLYRKGECIDYGSIDEPNTMDATFEGAKATIIFCWSKCDYSEKRNLSHHFDAAKAETRDFIR